MKTINIVLPALNEEQNINKIYSRLEEIKKRRKLKYVFKYVFVDDGSTDATFQKITELAKRDKNVSGISLSRNFGPQFALTCGIKNSGNADAVIIMDSDLQHPVSVIPKFIKNWEQGFNIVNAVRKSTEKEPFLKKWLSKLYYKVANFFLDHKIVEGGSDFKLLDKKAVSTINQFGEYQRFLRGLTSWVGFKQSYVYYKAGQRKYGTPGYSFSKSLNLAKVGIISLSVKPLSLISILGFLLTFLSCIVLIYGLIISAKNSALYFSPAVNLMLVNTFLIGIVLICLGLVAIYLSFVYKQVISRPLYIVSNSINLKEVK